MWEIARLGDLCEIVYGKSLDEKDRVAADGIPAYGANGIKTYSTTPLYDKPSIIIGRKGSAGELNKVIEPFWALDVAYYVKIDESLINLDFLFYSLTTLDLPSMARGVKPGINRNDVYNRAILLPPLAEQQRIVAKLDAAFAQIDRAIGTSNAKIKNLDVLKASILAQELQSETASWETVKFGDVVSYDKVNAQGSSLPYLGMENISSDTMELVGDIEVPVNTSSTFKFDESHVLYGRLRPYLRKVLLPDFSGQCSTELFCLKPSAILKRQYLAYWLLTPKVADKIEQTSTGARMPRANMNAILNFDFILPPFPEQQRIVAKLDAAFAEIAVAKDAVVAYQQNYQTLKSAILAQELQREAA